MFSNGKTALIGTEKPGSLEKVEKRFEVGHEGP